MFLGRYDFDGEPAALLAAYDALMRSLPRENIGFHLCITRAGGISVFDTCPTRAVFDVMSTDAAMLGAMRTAGLPPPDVWPLGEVHAALGSPDHHG